MSNRPFRPWGPLRWILERLPITKWAVLGTVGAEKRALAVVAELVELKKLGACAMLRLLDEDVADNRYFQAVERKTRRAERSLSQLLSRNGASAPTLRELRVLCDEEEILGFVRDFASACPQDVVIDVSTMPKRFFFPLLTVLQDSPRIMNIVVTYTVADRYGDVLAEDPEPWRPLPMYGPSMPDSSSAMLIVAVGYQPLQLHAIVDGGRFHSLNVKLLFPFPSIPPGVIRNWRFVRQITRGLQDLSPEAIVRVHTPNAPLAFDHIAALTSGDPNASVVLAPYGPKPISLAMCLFGVARRSVGRPVQIGYTQPRIYGDKYSIGIAVVDSVPVVHAYCVRLDGRNLYELPN